MNTSVPKSTKRNEARVARRCRGAVDVRSLTSLILEWVMAGITIAAAWALETWWAYSAAFVLVATRQHALLILFHDAVHGLLARDRRVNDGLINLFVGVPLLLPVEIYRPLHIAHHRALGTAQDPERRFAYVGQPWNFRPLGTMPLLRQLAGDLLLINNIRMIWATRRAGALAQPRPATLALAALQLAAVALAIWLAPTAATTALLLWFLPLLTLTQLLQKLRSFAEHSGGPGVTPGWEHWTYTWRTGLLGRLTVWPYNINYHLEHHGKPNIPWHKLSHIAASPPGVLKGRSLWRLLHAK